MSDEISIQFTRFSAFYSPLFATIAGGFLEEEGLDPRHSIAPVGKSAIEGVVAGTVHVCQSAPTQGFGPLEAALDVFQHSKLITKRHRYEDVIASRPVRADA